MIKLPVIVEKRGLVTTMVDAGGSQLIDCDDITGRGNLTSLADCINQLHMALHDSINRPMGVVPDSAMGLTDPDLLVKQYKIYCARPR